MCVDGGQSSRISFKNKRWRKHTRKTTNNTTCWRKNAHQPDASNSNGLSRFPSCVRKQAEPMSLDDSQMRRLVSRHQRAQTMCECYLPLSSNTSSATVMLMERDSFVDSVDSLITKVTQTSARVEFLVTSG